jgi:protein-disulfide isomerase
LAIAAPQIWPTLRPPDPLPSGLQQLQDPRQLTVIEFTDFECPACRAFHPVLARVLAEQGDAARLVRIHYPIASHRFAKGAARAAVCAEQQGRGEALAAALFEANDLSAVACRTRALSLGVDRGRFDACVAGDEVDAILKEHEELLRSTGYAVLPTTYVGRERLIGSGGGAERLRRAFERARGGSVELPGWAFAGAVALCVLALLLLGTRGDPTAESNPEAS